MFGDILKKLRQERGLSQAALADAVGVSKSTIGMYEQGNRLPHKKETKDTLKQLADFFDVSVDFLLGYSLVQNVITTEDRQKYGIRPVSTKKIPMIGRVACGQPIMCEEDFETFAEASSDIQADFCLTAQGDSMINARIFDGDIVFIREQESVDNGEIAAVIVNDDEITLKRFYYYPDRNQVILQPENPIYRPMVYNNEELNHIRVLGKAVAFTSKLN